MDEFRKAEFRQLHRQTNDMSGNVLTNVLSLATSAVAVLAVIVWTMFTHEVPFWVILCLVVAAVAHLVAYRAAEKVNRQLNIHSGYFRVDEPVR